MTQEEGDRGTVAASWTEISARRGVCCRLRTSSLQRFTAIRNNQTRAAPGSRRSWRRRHAQHHLLGQILRCVQVTDESHGESIDVRHVFFEQLPHEASPATRKTQQASPKSDTVGMPPSYTSRDHKAAEAFSCFAAHSSDILHHGVSHDRRPNNHQVKRILPGYRQKPEKRTLVCHEVRAATADTPGAIPHSNAVAKAEGRSCLLFS